MPANLTPQYLKAEEAFKAATTTEEKLAGLEEMLRQLPKHKGTEKIQADLKRRIAALKKEDGAKGKAQRQDPFHVVRAGGGQVVLLGAPNTGKSSLVGALTRAKVDVSPQPFATQQAVPGMMLYEDAPIQLVDLPAITADFIPPGLLGAVRNADGVLVLCDLSAADALEQAELALEACARVKLVLHPPGRAPEPTGEEPAGHRALPALIVAAKSDLPGARETLSLLAELLSERLPLIAVSCATGEGLPEFRRAVFELLGLIRVYSKEPGKPFSKEAPFLLPKGSTALELATRIHKDLGATFKYARVWGSARHDGLQVGRDHLLHDLDIVEVH